LLHGSDVRGGLPGELNVIFNLFGTLGLCVGSLNNVSVAEMPFALTLRLVIIELTLKVSTVGVTPLSRNNLTASPFTNKLHASLEEDVGALTMLLALLPVSRINILVGVGHNTFSVSEAVSPVSVVDTNSSIYHFTNTVLLVVLPSTNIFVLGGSSILIGLGEVLVRAFFTFSNLFNSNETVKLKTLNSS
jgi:hypothetical protein